MDRSVRQSMDPVRGGVHGPGVSVFGSPVDSSPKNHASLAKTFSPGILVRWNSEIKVPDEFF